MFRTIRILLRLLSIARILARHDALSALEETGIAPGIIWLARRVSRPIQRPILRAGVSGLAEKRPGQKLAAALAELGPSFIKLGQFLSTRADLLGEDLSADLSELQDRLPPFDSAAARDRIEAELERPLAKLFDSFDDQVISAASIAQVHRAVTTEGKEVAVKVLRPGIEQAFSRDLDLLYWIASVIERTQPRLRRFKPLAVVGIFEETVRIEMNLRMEASAASELAENFADDPTYSVPSVDWQRSSQRVLTMGRIGGIPIDDRAALLAAGHDLKQVLTRAAAIFFNQAFRDGFFHGDQHPGNMFVDDAGNIVAVDFGIMGRLDHKTRYFLADMLLATLAHDYRRLAEVHLEAGYLPPGQSLETFAQALRAVSEPIVGRSLTEISFARLLAQLLHLAESFNMPVQPQLLLLQKNMLMAEGVSRGLDPDLNIWTLAQPLIEEWMMENRGPEARLRAAGRDLSDALRRLPSLVTNVEKIAADFADGGLKLHPNTVRALGGRGGGRGPGQDGKARGNLVDDLGQAYGHWALWIALAALALALVALF